MSRDPTRDVVRGLTSLEMTFVNVSGLSWAQHSGYIGQITYADTIFPCFAFLSGMSPTPARRSAGLVGIGLGLNAVSAFAHGKPTVRIPGVLQRLGLASFLANEPRLAFLRRYYGAPLVLLWYTATLLGARQTLGAGTYNPLAHADYPAADASTTAQTRIDKLVVGRRLHQPSFDPEGLLGSLTTAVSMLLGHAFEAASLPGPHKAMAAAGMIAVGESLHYALPKYAPISKNLWTPSFVLVTSGVSVLKYLAVESGIPYLPTGFRDILSAVGRRSLEAYIFSTLLTLLFRLGGKQSLRTRCMQWIEGRAGAAVADFVTSLALTGAVAAFSEFLVAQNVRLRW